jgi:beta-lactamase class A
MRCTRAVLTAVCLILLGLDGLAQGPLQAELLAGARRRFADVAARVDGVVGYVVTDLTSGERVASHLEQTPFPTASTIKLAILYELLKQAEEGALSLDTAVPIGAGDVVGGSGIVQHLALPQLSLRDHAALMMIVSDNTSTNVVIDAVDPARVNARMAALGMGDMVLRRRMMDSEAARRGDENVATPASLARITEMLWKGEGLSSGSRDTALKLLRAVPGTIRSAVPSAVAVFSKTGTLEGVRAEAAIVDLPTRPFAIAVMTTYLSEGAEGERAIGDITRVAVSYFERLAAGGKYGRLP